MPILCHKRHEWKYACDTWKNNHHDCEKQHEHYTIDDPDLKLQEKTIILKNKPATYAHGGER